MARRTMRSEVAIGPPWSSLSGSWARSWGRLCLFTLSQQPVQSPQFPSRVRRASHGLLGNKPVSTENDIVLLNHFVNACGGYGEEAIFQALDPGFLPQIPERKFQVLVRASQQTFHLNDAEIGRASCRERGESAEGAVSGEE